MAESSRVDRRGERVDALRWGDESSLAIRWFLQLLKQGVDVHLFVHSSRPGLDQSASGFTLLHSLCS